MADLKKIFFPGTLIHRIGNNSGLEKILKNAGWLFTDKIIRLGIGVFVSVWIARYLGPKEFGFYNYAIAFVALFAPLTSLGLDSLVVRDLVKENEEKGAILGTTFILKLIGSISALLIISLIVFLMPSEKNSLTSTLILLAAFSLVFQNTNTIELWFQSQVQSKYTVYVRNFAFIMATALRFGAIQHKSPLIIFAIINLLESAIGTIGLTVSYLRTGNKIQSWKFDFQRAKSFLKEGWSLILSCFAVLLYLRIDQVILQQIASSEAVGIYSAAVRISEVWYFIPSVLISSFYPSVLEAKKLGEQIYESKFQKLFNLIIMISYAVAIPLSFSAGWLVKTVFGQDYAMGGSVLAVHVWGGLFANLSMLAGMWLINEGDSQLLFYSTVAGAISNIALNYLLIPSMGAMGAAIATLISYALSIFGLAFFHKKTGKILIMVCKSLILQK